MHWHWNSSRVKISIHALREEGDRRPSRASPRTTTFLSTPSARRATRQLIRLQRAAQHFYPRPPRGGRHTRPRTARCFPEFLSTPSARRATRRRSYSPRTQRFLSTPSARRATGSALRLLQQRGYFYPRPPRGGRLLFVCRTHNIEYFYPRPPRGGRLPRRRPAYHSSGISIHALREEGDQVDCFRLSCSYVISIHALREEGDTTSSFFNHFPMGFLSTPSARRATVPDRKMTAAHFYFYPRPPRGGRPAPDTISGLNLLISIHALREEGDARRSRLAARTMNFYPRPPRGGRPSCPGTDGSSRRNFYPRPPRGGRQSARASRARPPTFLSTPSARRATDDWLRYWLFGEISIHALREEGDHNGRPRVDLDRYFYPRPPRGGRLFGGKLSCTDS